MATYIPSADNDPKDGEVSKKELKAWNKAGRPVDQVDIEYLGKQHGYAASVIKRFDDLQGILAKILTEGITDPVLQLAEITDSDWFRSYLPSYLEVEKERLSMDPEIWNSRVQRTADNIKDKFLAAGAEIDDATAIKYAEQMLYGSSGDVRDGNFQEFDDAWLEDTIADAIDFTKTKEINGVSFYDLSGTAEATARALYDAAYAYGMDTAMSNTAFTSWFEKSMNGIMKGDVAVEDVDDELVDMAMSRFPGLANQLQRGMSLRDAASPYLKTIADVLEYDEGSLSMGDDLVQRVLNGVDESGAFKPMSLYDAKLAARRDPRWDYTETAKNEKTDIASMILKDFGFLG